MISPDELLVGAGETRQRSSAANLPGRKLDLRLLSQFLLVCDLGSMSAAARQLGITTAAISQTIVRLERDVGMLLLNRNASGLRPTPAGSELRERARHLLAEAQETIDALEAFRSRTIPRLRLLIMESAANFLVPTLVPYLDKLVGELIVLSARFTPFVEDFLRGDLDMLIANEELAEISDLERYPLCTEQLLVLLPAALPVENRNMEYLFAHLPYLSVQGRPRVGAMIENYFDALHAFPLRRIECATLAPILELIEAGFGWTITTPLAACAAKPDFDKVSCIHLGDNVPGRTLYLLSRKDKLADFPVRLANMCRQALADRVSIWRENAGVEAVGAISLFPQLALPGRG